MYENKYVTENNSTTTSVVDRLIDWLVFDKSIKSINQQQNTLCVAIGQTKSHLSPRAHLIFPTLLDWRSLKTTASKTAVKSIKFPRLFVTNFYFCNERTSDRRDTNHGVKGRYCGYVKAVFFPFFSVSTWLRFSPFSHSLDPSPFWLLLALLIVPHHTVANMASSQTQRIYETYHLHITPEKMYIEPLDAEVNQVLLIDRVTHETIFQIPSLLPAPGAADVRIVFGILGRIHLIGGWYLVAVTGRERVGEIDGQTIYQLTSAELFPYAKSLLFLNARQLEYNAVYKAMIENVLRTSGLYFSSTFDLTHSFQRLAMMRDPQVLRVSLF